MIEVLLIVSRMEDVNERNSMFKFRILHSRKKFPKDCQYVGFDFDLIKTYAPIW